MWPLSGYALVPGLEIEKPHPGDLPGIDKMLGTIVPEIEKATAT